MQNIMRPLLQEKVHIMAQIFIIYAVEHNASSAAGNSACNALEDPAMVA